MIFFKDRGFESGVAGGEQEIACFFRPDVLRLLRFRRDLLIELPLGATAVAEAAYMAEDDEAVPSPLVGRVLLELISFRDSFDLEAEWIWLLLLLFWIVLFRLLVRL